MAQQRFRLRHDTPTDEYRDLVLEWTRDLTREGRTTLGLPVEYGGGGDVGASVAAFETVAHADLSLLVKIGVQFGLWGGAVLHLGTRKHHEKYLADIVSLELPGCFAMTETGHGSNVQSLCTQITYDAEVDELVVHTPDFEARKDYIGNAARHGRMAAVFGQLVVGGEKRGVHCVLVPLRDDFGNPLPGVTIEDCGPKLGLNGVDNGRLSFADVRVPRENLLDRYAQITDDGDYYSEIENPTARFFTMIGTLIQGRVCVCGASIAAAKSALTIAVRHSLVRRQFGAPGADDEALLLDYRIHQHRLLRPLATVYALHFAQAELRGSLHKVFSAPDEVPVRERRELETFAAGLKAVATWNATSTIQTCREACGGAGYLAVNRFAALKADTDVFTTFEGDNTVLLQLVAKSLLTDYKDHFGELDPLGMAAFFAGRVFETIAERTAAREIVARVADELLGRRDGDEDLFDREVLLALFNWREEHMLESLARRLKGGIDADYDPFEVFIYVQDHVALAARAHVDRLVLEAFDRAIQEVEDEHAAELLDKLFALHALGNIYDARGWFQEHGRLSSARSKALIKNINHLLPQIRAHAAELVDAFDIPQEVLAQDIGLPEAVSS